MDIIRGMSEALELPKEVTMDLPLISIIGREEMTVENHKGILSFTEECVRIGTKAGSLAVKGQLLCIKQLTADTLVLTGRVSSLDFLT